MIRRNFTKELELSHDALTARLDYDPYSGLFTWRDGRCAGRVAGTINPIYGRRVIRLGDRTYYASRLAWFYMYKKWPRFEVDHKNRKPLDDRYLNLRQATRSQNCVNREYKNSTGVRGVSFRFGKFIAYVKKKGKMQHLGCFATLAEAKQARETVDKALHGKFAYVSA